MSEMTDLPAKISRRELLSFAVVSCAILAGIPAGWASAIYAGPSPLWLSALVPAALGVLGWASRTRSWLCAFLASTAFTSALGWVLLVMVGDAQNF